MDEFKNNTFLQAYQHADTALQLRVLSDQGIELSKEFILRRLSESSLVQQLTGDFIDKPLFYVWRLIALSEIPGSIHLDYTKKLVDIIYDKLATPFGFSLSGNEKMFLPCYNAMLVSALCRLGHADDPQVATAANWIVRHQPMERGVEVISLNLKFEKYGGCYKSVPCYIGLAKSVMALIEYGKYHSSPDLLLKKEKGLEYILSHLLYKRLSVSKPITPRIIDISFPESYHLNIVELLRILMAANRTSDPRAQDAIQYILSKKQKDGRWKINYRYKADGYIVFDQGSKTGDWVSYIIQHSLNNDSIS